MTNNALIKHTSLLNYPEISHENLSISLLNTLDKQIILAVYDAPKLKTIDLTHKTGLIPNSKKTNPDGSKNEDEPEFIQGITGSQEVANLLAIVAKMIWDSGQRIDKKEQLIIISNIITELRENEDYKNLTIPEIEIAFKRGVRKKYGEFYGINITTINMWLDAYMETTRIEALSRIPVVLALNSAPINPEPTKEEKKRLHDVWINDCYEAYVKYCVLLDSKKQAKGNGKKDKSKQDVDNIDFYDYQDKLYKDKSKQDVDNIDFYDYQDKLYIAITEELKLVKLTNKERKEVWGNAIEVKKKEGSSPVNSFGKRIEIRKTVEAIAKGDEAAKEGLKPVARRLALPILFKKIKEMGIDFKEELAKIKNTF